MNKKFFGLIFSACLPGLSLAANGITLGGGPNLSFTDLEEGAGQTNSVRYGFNAGIGYETDISRFLSIAAEANIETRGMKSDGLSSIGEAETTLKLLYLQVPVLAVAKFPLGTAALGIYGGPSIGLNLSSDLEVRNSSGQGGTADLKDDTKLFNFGIEAGLDMEFAAAGGRVFIRPGYYLGMTEVYREDGGGPKHKLVDVRLRIGYRIPW
jgi:hypothetical protein